MKRLAATVTPTFLVLTSAFIGRVAWAEVPAAEPVIERVYDLHDLLWSTPPQPGESRRELVDNCAQLLTETISPEKWKISGGTLNDLVVKGDRFAITASAADHKQVTALLEQLRESSDVAKASLAAWFIHADEQVLKKASVDPATKPVRLLDKSNAAQLLDLVRGTPGSVNLALPRTVLRTRVTSHTIGREHAMRLPVVGEANRVAEIERLTGIRLECEGIATARHATIRLSLESAGYDATDDAIVEESAKFRGAFVMPVESWFLVCVPIVKSNLEGIREENGHREVIAKKVEGNDDNDEPRRYLLMLGSTKLWTRDELVAFLGEREARDVIGIRAACPVKPGQDDADQRITSVYDLRPLIWDDETHDKRRDAEESRAKAIQQELSQQLKPERLGMRVLQGQLIITTTRDQQAIVRESLDRKLEEKSLR